MLALSATIALLLSAELPRDPCADLESARAALRESAGHAGGELDVTIERLQSALGIRFDSAADPDTTAEQRAELVASRLASWCVLVQRPVVSTEGHFGAAPSISDILNRPEFAHARDRRRNAIDSLLNAIVEWFKSLLATSAAQSIGAFSRWVRTLVLTGAALLVLLAVLRLRMGRGRPKARALEVGGDQPLELDDPATHLARARAAMTPDPRGAIREGLLALLSALERRRWARPDRVKTNRELSDELPRRGAPEGVVRRVDELVRWYDQTFYSLEPVRADDARTFIEAIAGFEAQLTAGQSR